MVRHALVPLLTMRCARWNAASTFSDSDIHRALERGENIDFEQTELCRRVFALADQVDRAPQPHALLPRISLESPKITRKLATGWFANRVGESYRACLSKGP